MPSTKPFVIVRISQENLEFLERLAEERGDYVGCVAVELIEQAVARLEREIAASARRLSVVGGAMYGERPTRMRWLLTPKLHRRLHALPWDGSMSRLVDAMVADARLAAARNTHRRARTERTSAGRARPRSKPQVKQRWPWRERGLSLAEAKSAWRRFVLTHHPDRGGDSELFLQGKDDWESTQLG